MEEKEYKYEHKKSDLEHVKELQRRISTMKAKIAALPPFQSAKDISGHGKMFNDFANMEEEYELLLEAARVSSVTKNHKKEHEYYSERCPICLEDIRVFENGSTAHFVCCGGSACSECFKQNKLRTCPLCRGKFPDDAVKANELSMKCAERGVAWAQYDLAMEYVSLLVF